MTYSTERGELNTQILESKAFRIMKLFTQIYATFVKVYKELLHALSDLILTTAKSYYAYYT